MQAKTISNTDGAAPDTPPARAAKRPRGQSTAGGGPHTVRDAPQSLVPQPVSLPTAPDQPPPLDRRPRRWRNLLHGGLVRLPSLPGISRIRIFDRYLLRSYVSTWLICLVSLVGLYVVIDLFENLDEFHKRTISFGEVARNMLNYYQYQFFKIFDLLSGIICQIAAISTLGLMQRRNEALPMVMAGVPMRRMLYPLLAATALVAGLGVVNRELILPQISEQVQRNPANSLGTAKRSVLPCYDSESVLIDGKDGLLSDADQRVTQMILGFPPGPSGRPLNIRAEVGYYQPPTEDRPGGWLLESTDPKRLPYPHPKIQELAPARMFYETDVTFLYLVRTRRWIEFASTAELLRVARSRPADRRLLELQIHRRLLRPVLELMTVLLAIPFVIYRQGRQLPLCLVISLGAFVLYRSADYVASHLAFPLGLLPASLGAWLPLLVFGPAVLYLYSDLES